MQIRLKRGLNIRLGGAPDQSTVDRPGVASVGLSGLDHPELRPEFLVEIGHTVAVGQPLLRDRRRPDIVVTAPAGGEITTLARRDPETGAFFIGLSVSDTARAPMDVPSDWRHGDAVRRTLLRSGLWTALLERPFGRVPDPDGAPDAILVTATAADALSPDPALVIEERQHDLVTGIEALRRLTDGPVHLCQHEGPELAPGAIAFNGPYPAGLPGTQVHHVFPVDAGRRVWTISYQDVMAIGRLLSSRQLDTERIVALAGPGVQAPCLLRVPVGAGINDLTVGRLRGRDHRIVSGPFLSGRETQYLGRGHHQVCVLKDSTEAKRKGFALGASSVGPIIPVAGHRDAFPFDLPAVPLLRALAVGDSETAQTHGCLELLEEDIAVLSYVCPSGTDYAPLLRAVLDELRHVI